MINKMDILFKVIGWIFFVLFSFGTLLTISEIGKKREILTPQIAMGTTVVNAILLLWIYWAILGGA